MGSDRAMSAEFFVVLGAAICVAPVLFGFVVTRWVIGWSDPARRGRLRDCGADDLV